MKGDAFDAIIVGGGPAGSSCARTLHQAGWRVCIVERKRFPRDKVCAGWVTPEVWRLLAIEPAEYGRRHVLQPIRRFRVGLIGGDALEIAYDDVMSYGIRRCEFDAFVVRRSGATLIDGEPVRAIERRQDGWRINGRLHAPVLVGAGGHFCPVARFLGARTGRGERAVHAREIEFRLPATASTPVAGDRPELYFCPDMRGYGWLFRKGDWLNVGLGRNDDAPLAAQADAFVDWLVECGRLDARPEGAMHGHAYLLAASARRNVVADGVLLVGDAAGLAYSPSGEGIRPAVESGILAARALLDCRGDFRAARLQAYARALQARFGRGDSSPDWPARLVRPWFRVPGFVRRYIVERGFLRRHQPPLSLGSGAVSNT